MSYSLRQKLGAVIYDLPRYAKGLWPLHQEQGWILICNREERIIQDANRVGVRCDWQWTSDLHIAKVFPRLGLGLMRKALRDWPIGFNDAPVTETGEHVQVSFIIGHRGSSRVPHLLATLRSIAAQRNIRFECIVVEQSNEPEIESLLPPWVRYVHTSLPKADMPYSRSWAFNVGAELARGNLLILHDNDMLVPQDYASQMLARQSEGYEVVNLKRFVFYLAKNHSERILTSEGGLFDTAPEAVVQNLEAGGSFAMTRDAYMDVGGFDESFVGWGGEDNEFWERAQTRKVWPYGYLAFVHLWHPAQTDKFNQARVTAELLEMRTAIAPEERIAELKSREFGRLVRIDQRVPNRG